MDKTSNPIKLSDNMNKEVTLQGTARDAKGGAVLLLSNDVPIYIEDLPCWPDDLFGKHVSVTGILRKKKLIPDPYISPDGGISQGAMGMQTILEKAKWKLIDN